MWFKCPNADVKSFEYCDTVLSTKMLGSLIKSYNWRVNGLINLSAETVIARIVYGSEGIMLFCESRIIYYVDGHRDN